MTKNCVFQKCRAECCRYVSVYMKTPRSMADYDEIKWFVAHENVTVYQDLKGEWMVEFATPCKCLAEDHTCGIYQTRPMVCAEYDPDNCTTNSKSKPYKLLFTTPDEVDAYMRKRWKKK